MCDAFIVDVDAENGVAEVKAEGAPDAVLSIQSPDDILMVLEENMAQLQGMQGQAKTVDYFIDQVNKWQRVLGTSETVLKDWLEVKTPPHHGLL